MKPVLLALGAIVLIFFAPTVLTSVNSFLISDHQAQYDVTTGAGVTTATVTLAEDLYNNETSRVTVTSNQTADAPIASSYASATNVLTVSGLAESLTHRLTIDYEIDGLSLYYGAGVGGRVLPMFLVLGIIGIIAGAVYSAVKRGD